MHAQRCLEIVGANRGAALERFFGWEALGIIDCAAGRTSDHASALNHARVEFAALSPDDQSWCKASLDALEAALTSPAPD